MTERMTKKKDVVNFDGVQAAPPETSGAASKRSVPKSRSRLQPTKKQQRTQSSPSVSKRVPISVRLSVEDRLALDAVRGPLSRSHYIITALREHMAREGDAKCPTSLGVADGIYGATIHDDVVALANQLAAFEFLALRALDRLPQDREADELRKYFDDARRLLCKSAGKPFARDQ